MDNESATATVTRLMRPLEAAEALGVSRSYLYQQVADGHLAAVHLGTGSRPVMRIHPRDLDRFIEDRRVA